MIYSGSISFCKYIVQLLLAYPTWLKLGNKTPARAPIILLNNITLNLHIGISLQKECGKCIRIPFFLSCQKVLIISNNQKTWFLFQHHSVLQFLIFIRLNNLEICINYTFLKYYFYVDTTKRQPVCFFFYLPTNHPNKPIWLYQIGKNYKVCIKNWLRPRPIH